AAQEEINRVIVEQALAGKRVARFKGGDNFVFGRGYEEIIACRDAGVPVTHRGVTHEFTVISGHLPPGHPESLTNWAAVGQLNGTLVLMMAVENAPAIASALLVAGRDPGVPVAVICDGSMPTERTVLATLGTLADVLD